MSGDPVRGYDRPAGGWDALRSVPAIWPGALVPLSSFAEGSRTPTSKSIPVIVRPHRGETPAHRDIHASLVR